MGGSEFRQEALQQAVNCEKAEAIVSEVGFKEIKAEFCVWCDTSFQREPSNSFLELCQSLLFRGELTALI